MYGHNQDWSATMKSLVVYESMYGSTRAIAEAVARGLREGGEVDVIRASRAGEVDTSTYDFVVVGSPTHVHGLGRQRTRDAAVDAASRPTSTLKIEEDASHTGVREWLSTLSPSAGAAAAFDTRLDRSPLFTGRASKTIARRLRRVGRHMVAAPESFLVDKQWELKRHEIERAEEWALSLVGLASNRMAPGHR
jgi:hypothetical protein